MSVINYEKRVNVLIITTVYMYPGPALPLLRIPRVAPSTSMITKPPNAGVQCTNTTPPRLYTLFFASFRIAPRRVCSLFFEGASSSSIFQACHL